MHTVYSARERKEGGKLLSPSPLLILHFGGGGESEKKKGKRKEGWAVNKKKLFCTFPLLPCSLSLLFSGGVLRLIAGDKLGFAAMGEDDFTTHAKDECFIRGVEYSNS